MVKTILILGYSGMLGSRISSALIGDPNFKVILAGRTKPTLSTFQDIDFIKFDAASSNLEVLILSSKPDYVINAFGWIKQKDENRSLALILNSVIPNQLAEFSERYNFNLIHFSTDCVFDGFTGNYNVNSPPNPTDFYGRTKYLGEVNGNNVMCIRSSLIGYEVNSRKSLLEWILSQKKQITGYSNAIFSGVSTNEIANLVYKVILREFEPGLFHVASEPISKLNLIKIVKSVFSLDFKISVDDSVIIDRSLRPNYKELGVNWTPLDWQKKIDDIMSTGRLQ